MTTQTRPALADQIARNARIRERAAAIDAATPERHAHRIAHDPFNSLPRVERTHDSHAIATAIDDADGYAALGQMAKARNDVQRMLAEHPEASDARTLSDREVKGLALEALAALGRVADRRHPAGTYRPAYLTVIDGYLPVGPYVSDAVAWVWRGGNGPADERPQGSPADYALVQAWALMFNVATR